MEGKFSNTLFWGHGKKGKGKKSVQGMMVPLFSFELCGTWVDGFFRRPGAAVELLKIATMSMSCSTSNLTRERTKGLGILWYGPGKNAVVLYRNVDKVSTFFLGKKIEFISGHFPDIFDSQIVCLRAAGL